MGVFFHVRYVGDTIHLGVNFVSEKEDIARLADALGDAIQSLA